MVKKHLMNQLFVVPLETRMINTGRINQQRGSCWWSSCLLHSCYNRQDHRSLFTLSFCLNQWVVFDNRTPEIKAPQSELFFSNKTKQNKNKNRVLISLFTVPFRSPWGLLLTLVLLNKDINMPFSPPPKSLIAGVGKDRQMDTHRQPHGSTLTCANSRESILSDTDGIHWVDSPLMQIGSGLKMKDGKINKAVVSRLSSSVRTEQP